MKFEQDLEKIGNLLIFETIVIVPLLLPILFGKRGIFTRSPLLWVSKTLLFSCHHVHLPCFIILTGLIIMHLQPVMYYYCCDLSLTDEVT